jgi:hypothetical protein
LFFRIEKNHHGIGFLLETIHVTGSALGVLSRTSGSYNLIIF